MKSILFILFALEVSFGYTQSITPQSEGLKIIHTISANPVQDQSLSSTCWSFASNSFIESELMKHSVSPVKLSEMFIARYSYINKVYQYLAKRGGVFFTPGGQFHDVIKVIKKYGMVPEDIYYGAESNQPGIRYDHQLLDTAMHILVLRLLKEDKISPSANDLLEINKLLDKYIGTVPATFIYRGRSYTPLSFAKNYLHFDPEDYIEITSYTHHLPYTKFILEDKYNWTLDYFHNVPLHDFMEITDNALKTGYSVCWDGDVEEPGFLYEQGIAYLLKDQNNSDLARQTTFEDKTTSIDHMMHVIGTATDKDHKSWYYVKNSWGNTTNAFGGYLFMQRDYFKIKTVAIIVNKNAIPEAIRKKMKL